MWISKSAANWLSIAQDTVNQLREENVKLKAENNLLNQELSNTKVHLDWLRVQYNQAQHERAELLEKVHGIRTMVPELGTKRPSGRPSLEEFNFDDIGDEVAAKLGLPSYGLPNN